METIGLIMRGHEEDSHESDGEAPLTTTVEVNDNNCGYKTLITVSKLSADQLSLNIQGDCNNVKELLT